ARAAGTKQTKATALSTVRAFVQNIHHFRDDALASAAAPVERVVIFDEAQRAWDLRQTAAFMKSRKGIPGFSMSDPEFLLSVMNRHVGWATIICLIGGGQEINTGEAGLAECVSVNSFLDTFGPKIRLPQPRHTVAPVAPGQGFCLHAVQSARFHCIDAG